MSSLPSLSSNYAWFKFDEQPSGGSDLAVDSNGIFDNIRMNNAGTYDADKWLSPSILSGGCGASKTPSIVEQEFIRLDTLAGALLVHYWLDVPSGAVTENTVFSYGSRTTKTDNFALGATLNIKKKPSTLTVSALKLGNVMPTGQHAVAHVIDVANNTNITIVDAIPKSSSNLGNIPAALPAVNKFGFLLNQTNGAGTTEFGEGNTGNLRISDLMIVRIETDKSYLFPTLFIDKYRADRFMIPSSWEGL